MPPADMIARVDEHLQAILDEVRGYESLVAFWGLICAARSTLRPDWPPRTACDARLIAAAPDLLAACEALDKAFTNRPIGGGEFMDDLLLHAVRLARHAEEKAKDGAP